MATDVYPPGIYPEVTGLNNVLMDQKREHRRLRFIELLQLVYKGERGGQARAAQRIGCNANYVTRLLSDPDKKGHKRIGEETQEDIETAFGLCRGWLDMPLGTPLDASQRYEAQTVREFRVEEKRIPYRDIDVKLESEFEKLRLLGDEAKTEAISFLQYLLVKYESQAIRAGIHLPATKTA